MRARIPRHTPKVPERPREGMSEPHRKAIKRLPCVGCGALKGCDPHHLMRGLPQGERGMSRPAADRYAIPLCRTCHEKAHGHGDDEAWLTARGIDGRSLAEALWREREDPGRMFRVVVRSLNARGIYADLAGAPHA